MLSKIHRIYIQAASATLLNLPFLAVYLKYIPAPVLNCYACPLAASACPIGTLQFFFLTGQIPYFALAFLGIYGLFLGRTFCGYLCPFGWIQELLFKLSKKEIHLPEWIGYLKYAILLIFVGILPVIYLSPVFCKICPAGTLEAALPVIGIDMAFSSSQSNPLSMGASTLLGMIGFVFYLKLLILLIFLGLFIFIKRPFCRICPLGAVFSFFTKLSFFNRSKRDNSNCKTSHCKNCFKKCPAGINPVTDYLSKNCIQCNECKKQGCSI